jgi:hypothetical protein
MKIFLSGAHGSACSMVKSQLTGVHKIDPLTNTCHESWTARRTTGGHSVEFFHNTDPTQYRADINVWLRVSQANIIQIVQRIVVLDFIYTYDANWVAKDHCWTPEKHARIAGPDWPPYSANINDYPGWCLNELCQVAYDRTLPWTVSNPEFDLEIDSSDLFSFQDPAGLRSIVAQLGSSLNHNFLYQWRMKNFLLWQQHKHRFTWQPGDNLLQ